MDRQMYGRTDDPITRYPRRSFQAGGHKKDLRFQDINICSTVLHIDADDDTVVDADSGGVAIVCAKKLPECMRVQKTV